MVRLGLVLLFSSLCLGVSDARAQTKPQAPSSPKPLPPAQAAAANPYAAALAGFQQRIDAYLAMRNAISQKIPEVKETGDPTKISGREKALGQAIAMARASAKAGDVFGDLGPHLWRILEDDWKSRSPEDQKALFHEDPPLPSNLALKVNQPYPTTLPLVTVPAKLLAQLPMLPEQLEYRVVDRRLLLRDRDANLIVDVLVGTPVKRAQEAPVKREK